MQTRYIIGAVILLAVIGIGYYGISPLFRNVEVQEASPETSPAASNTAEPPSSPVVETTAHPASGEVRVIHTDGKAYLRYENFKTINGPDLYVYLSKDLDAKEFVSLGRLRATEGNINYEIPEGVNVSDYKYALVWCKAFGVLFNYAELRSS